MPSLSKSLMTQVAQLHFDSEMRKAAPSGGGAAPFGSTTPSGPRFAPPPRPGATRSPTLSIGGHRAPPGPRSSAPNPRDSIEPLCDAIRQAVDQWRLQAHFVGIVIHGPTASGGRLEGPTLENHIRAFSGQLAVQPDTKPWAERVAEGVSECWERFCDAVTVPPSPWYPQFAAYPGAHAPPTQNQPMALLTCAGAASGMVNARALEQAMTRGQRGLPTGVAALYGAIAKGLEAVVQTWLQAQLITQVMGTGPVPGFVPGYVPAAPVVGGHVLPTPPHLGS